MSKEKLGYILMFLKQLKIDNLPLDNCVYDMRKISGDIIALLKRGEAYEKMWGTFKHERGCTYAVIESPELGTIADDMNKYEQKYLKEAK